MNTNYTLLDGVERNAKHPDTFEIPSVFAKATVKPGTFVKLGFILVPTSPTGPEGERMWVKVTGEGVGTLHNVPLFVNIDFGDEVKFSPEHILSIYEEDTE